jgi:hypothetical protein
MFFFFMGGVEHQVKQVVKAGFGRCISCGSRADLVEHEKVLKLFFIPVKRWPAKGQLMHCNNCRLFFPPSLAAPVESTSSPSAISNFLRCQFCSREVDYDFSYCPYCGSAI